VSQLAAHAEPPAPPAWRPSTLWIERAELGSPLVQRVVARLRDASVYIVDDVKPADRVPRFADGKHHLVLQRHRGSFLHHCPAGATGMVCCNYLVLNFGSNCPFDCSYCFLQDYLANNPALKVFTNPGAGLDEIDGVLRAHPQRTFRVGTGELMDSLALDPLTDLSSAIVPFFAERANAVLELKTKSACIDNLLRLDPRERVVVSWSMNTPRLAADEEHGTASFADRVAAAARVQAAGYRVGFHFDPLIAHDGWEDAYRDALVAVFTRVDPRRVAWVSLGSLRLTPRLKAAIKARSAQGLPPSRQVLTGELVPGPDGKQRVWRGLRVKMYRQLLKWLREVDGRMPLYICMEPAAVWERTMGAAPSDRQVADGLVAGY
jgi:spore photoproduct lyase